MQFNELLLAIAGPAATGDMVSVDRLEVLTPQGRLKALIKSGWKNVHPAEVEAVLRDLPGVANCAVAGVSVSKWDEAVKPYISRKRVAKPDPTAMTCASRQHIAGHKLPRYIEFVATISREPAGISGAPVCPTARSGLVSLPIEEIDSQDRQRMHIRGTSCQDSAWHSHIPNLDNVYSRDGSGKLAGGRGSAL